MAKKYEFKPDKTGAGFWNKLYLTRKQRQTIGKWLLYALVVLTLSVLQDVVFCRVRVFGASTELVPCGIFLICVLEGAESGGLFALIASALYLFSGSAGGTFVIVLLTVFAVLAAIFRQSYLQKGFSATMLCVAGAMLFYELTSFGMVLFLGQTNPGRFWGFCLTAGLSLLAAPVLYPIVKAIGTIGGESWRE